ncbi:unnamed protein product [Linum trigynum]|uniref:Uncharacterized protein n=1 Tax=Linum trigynum TaxID=586398 RepID=A0AAV2CG66_9ROSI
MISLQVWASSSSFQGKEILQFHSKNALKSPSLSLVRPLCVWDPKPSSPLSFWLKICLKGHQWPKHGRGHGRVMPQPARALARVNYTASAMGETRPCLVMGTTVLWVDTAVLCARVLA